MTRRPLILLTNDDGIQSPGLHAAARAVKDLGELLVVAPSSQQTAAGRSFRGKRDAVLEPYTLEAGGEPMRAFHLEGTPACVVRHAIQALCAEHWPDLVISGINYGENVGTSISSSGTVGAAIEAASMGIPAIAVSQQTHPDYFMEHGEMDWTASGHFLKLVAGKSLMKKWPFDVDILKIDVPENATIDTPWALTRQSRRPYIQHHLHEPSPKSRLGDGAIKIEALPHVVEPGSDVYALALEKKVAITPLSLDATSRADFASILQLVGLK